MSPQLAANPEKPFLNLPLADARGKIEV